MSRTVRVETGGGSFGCIGVVLTCLFLWALVFGVTVGGKHYGLSCSQADGVRVNWGDRR